MPTKTLHFPSPRHLSQLYGGRDENLQLAERALGVRLVTREDWLKVEGDDGSVARTEGFFNFL
ncbi:MAG TPA: PhoH family protein, partial [Opitutaceae bacterium]|nr:PhoH family protein [Opitutaceae bacterium]